MLSDRCWCIVDGINVSLHVTVCIKVINWLKEENVVSIHCFLGSISYIYSEKKHCLCK